MPYSAQRRLKSIAWRVLRTRFFNVLRSKICHSSVFELKGRTQSSGCDFYSLVFAHREIAHYFSKISFYKDLEPRYIGRVRLDDVPSIIAKTAPDVAFLCANRVFSEFLIQRGFVLLPYVNFSLDISDSRDLIYSRMNRSKRKEIRRVEKLGYSYEATREYEKLRMFYYAMYLPRVSYRHGQSAEVVSFTESERLFRKGGLLFTKLNGKYVSGAIYVYKGDALYVPMLGIADKGKYLTEGSGLSPLSFLISWGKKNRFKKIDYGSCQPFLKSGLFQYKKGLGMRIQPITEDDGRILAIRFCNFEKGTQDFILSNPFVFADGEHLRGLAIFNPDEDLHSTYYVPGLSSIIILCLSRDASQLKHRYESILKVDSGTPSPISHLLQLASEEGYEAFSLNFLVT